MFAPSEYELVDFGAGRKLERFGGFLLDRPCPAAESAPQEHLGAWRQAHARFDRSHADRGVWLPADALPAAWTVRHGELTFELKPTPFGHLGLFPEQAANWVWVADQVRPLSQRAGGPKVLNLFAYTGGSTLAAAVAGAEVVHVDSARNVVAWARRNAELSGLSAAPIRWIIEDAAKFVAREVRRGNPYDAVILDPPSYGHGPRGQSWQLVRDLPPLLRGCLELTRGRPKLLLVTCHSEDHDAGDLIACVRDAGLAEGESIVFADKLDLATTDGRKLNSGVYLRAHH